jgi:hypothetical protein
MALTFNTVNGVVPDTQTSIYTASASGGVIIGDMTFHNKSGSPVELTIFLRQSTDSRQLFKIELVPNGTLESSSKRIIKNTDQIEVIAGTAATIDYWISLIERT